MGCQVKVTVIWSELTVCCIVGAIEVSMICVRSMPLPSSWPRLWRPAVDSCGPSAADSAVRPAWDAARPPAMVGGKGSPA